MRLISRSNTAARDTAIRRALTLRAPALALLAGRPLTDADRAALGAGAVAWHVFLTAECCAAPLACALRRAGAWNLLAPEARFAIAAAEARELQRALAARAQLAELDALAVALGVMPIVLKGGACIAEGATVDLGDLDLLVTGDVADLLARALVARGHARTTDGDETKLQIDGRLPVELHTSLPYGRVPVAPPADVSGAPSIAPLAAYRALRRLVGAPALMMLLRHCVLHHPSRRGHLRDLVVIAEALGRCTEDEVAAVARTCASDAHGPELSDTLALALALHTGAAIVDPPAVRRSAAHKYLFALGTWTRTVRVAPRWPTLLCAALDRPAARRAPLWNALVSGSDQSSPWSCGSIGRGAPRLTAAVVAPLRVIYRAGLVLCAVAAGPFARRRVARLLA